MFAENKGYRLNWFQCFGFGTYRIYACRAVRNGQTGVLFLGRENLNKTIEWDVRFAISNKRKRIKAWIEEREDLDDTTGTCGLEGLIWAKNGILEFEKFIKEYYLKRDKCKKHRITISWTDNKRTISWTDNKRKKVYRRYLKRYGYELKIHYGAEFLVKDVF